MDNKQTEKIKAMTEGGLILSLVMEEAVKKAQVGVSGLEIEELVVNLMKKHGVEPSFKKVKGYRYATCVCINDTVVHGVPTSYQFQKNDIVGIDIGVYHKGYHTDMSWSKVIETGLPDEETRKRKKFLGVGYQTLLLAIDQVIKNNRVGNISQAIEQNIKKNGLSIVKQLVGHAVGEKLHEFPQIPGILHKPLKETPLLTSGMTLAVEIIYAQKKADIVYKNADGWTIVTSDGSFAGLFETTVAILENETKIITPFGGLLKEPGFDIIS
ncbi:type I methionyl aminopeptidase [Candidatus Microgenomates bacterium]|nr:type I methionyl aminopeptidase [Candidatus Microgenomates bacterium]